MRVLELDGATTNFALRSSPEWISDHVETSVIYGNLTVMMMTFFFDAGKSIPVHLGYVEEYLDNIVKFVVEKVQSSPKPSLSFFSKHNGL